MNIAEILEMTARRAPEKTALVFKGERYSYRTIVEQINRLAGGLKNRGMKRGDRLAILLPNSPTTIYSFYAAAVIAILTEIWACGAAYAILKKHLGWRPNFDCLLKASVAALVMCVVLWLFRHQGLLVQAVVGFAAYCVLVFLTGAVSRESIRSVLGRT